MLVPAYVLVPPAEYRRQRYSEPEFHRRCPAKQQHVPSHRAVCHVHKAETIVAAQLHQIPLTDIPPAEALMETEAKILAKAGTDFAVVPPRYRTPYFSHIMGGYSAGYYSYIWSEVLDAESVKWFKENGGLKRENGDHFRNTLLSRGGSQDAMQLFRDFRGADPSIEPLLERRGLN